MNNNDYESGFEKIQNAAREAFENIENHNSKATKTICDNAKKAADYQAEYDALMNQKRFRTLSTYENKTYAELEQYVYEQNALFLAELEL